MKKLVSGAAAAVAVAGGAYWYDGWVDDRYARCEARAVQLRSLTVLNERPAGMPTDDVRELAHAGVAEGCDEESGTAYAARQFYGRMEQAAVVRHVRETAGRDGWTETEPGTFALRAEKKLDSGRLYLRLSFPVPDAYEVVVSENR